MGTIAGLAGGYLQSLLGTVLQGVGSTTKTTGNTQNVTGTSSLALPADTTQLSPFAQLMSTLQQLQQSDPTKYQQVTQQIATNLQSAAQTAQSQGNTTAANQLNQLSTDFTSASKTGQLPNIQDLAQAASSGHHHHHHFHSSSTNADSSSSSSTNPLSQLLSAFQTNATESNSLNSMSIIQNTLSNAGITIS